MFERIPDFILRVVLKGNPRKSMKKSKEVAMQEFGKNPGRNA